MKKNLFIAGIFAAVTLLFASCSKDNNQALIVGTWRIVESSMTTYVDGKYVDTQVFTPEVEMLYFFNADGTMMVQAKVGSGTQAMTGTYKVTGKTLTLNLNKLGIDDVIVVETENVTIESLTDSSVILSSENSNTVGGKVYRYISKSTFMKIKQLLSSLVGKWKLVQRELLITTLDGTVVQHERKAPEGTVIYEFKSDGSCLYDENGHVTNSTYMKSGDTLVIVYDAYSYSEECTIEEFTFTRLVLVSSGINGSEKYHTSLTLQRL